MLDNQESPSKELDAQTGENIEQAYIEAKKLASKFNTAVTLHYNGIGLTVKPMRLGRKIHDLQEQLTATQQALDSAVEALKRITMGGKVAAYNSHTDTELLVKLLDETVGVARTALASIKE